MTGAPAGVSQDLQQFTRFRPGSTPESITLHTCAAIYDVLKEASSTNGAALQNGGTERYAVQLNLTAPMGVSGAGTKSAYGFISPIFDLIASSFVRYRIRKLIFHYEPQSAATDGERLVFAFANDPLHPLLVSTTPPTQATLLALADSIAFMPWRAWSMDVTEKLGQDRLYTYSDPSTALGDFTERFSDFGVISAITSSNSGTDAPGGVLYMETVVELEEFCPISVTRPSSLLRIKERAEHHLEVQKAHTLKCAPPEGTCSHGIHLSRTCTSCTSAGS